MNYIVGVDIGGTFTDCAVFDPSKGSFTTAKAATTPANPAEGFFAALESAAAGLKLTPREFLSQTRILVNASTTGTNAIVTKRGARIGLLTTAGHGQSLSIMNGSGRSKGLDVDELLYMAGSDKPRPLVSRDYIEEITERIDCKGDVVVRLDERQAEEAIGRLVAKGIDALAICLLWSFQRPDHELALKRLAGRIAPHLFISCSCEVSPFLGEHGRTVATLFNAYIGPLMGRYIEGINSRARAGGLNSDVMFARCVGGCVPPAEVAAAPLYTVDSGPVSGVQGSGVLGPKMGYDNIITTDMGGTTFDVGIVYKGVPLTRNETVLDRFEMRLPMIDVVSIGAGGGSIAYIDSTSNTMKVGPRSAGAEPGPMCYGKGGAEPTVTDANVVLGIINPDYFLGGERRLDVEAAHRGIANLASELGLSLESTAAGICRIVDSRMAGEIRRLTLFRGYDPRDFVVFAFGGGGPTHAAMYARELGVKKVAVPLGNAAAAWSALGTFVGGMVHLYERNLYLREPIDMGALNAAYAEMERQAEERLRGQGFDSASIVLERTIAIKYCAQVSHLEITMPNGKLEQADANRLVDDFQAVYTQRYGEGAGYREAGVEVLRLRLKAVGVLPQVELTQAAAPKRALKPRVKSRRQVYWWEIDRYVDTPIFDGGLLRTGHRMAGPAIIELPHTTVPVRPAQTAEVDRYGNLLINV
ncbi:MAG TPA: hydantoinase/oxoprolinase family protein [Candidatus Binataceae bacterium]|jgi:N-methylhydantoinase A|nr:hydantoinase/oxoprolinase family protein [Candidatus Binataceae bacterium]